MIGRRNKFVFVHVAKVAGQSVTKALRPHALYPHQRVAQRVYRLVNRKTKGDLYGLYRGGEHGSALAIREAMGAEAFDAAFSFGFVRNPWDWLYSLYKFERIPSKKRTRQALAQSSTFPEFVDGFFQEENYPTQEDFLIDADGEIMVDFVGRFETLEQDFARVCDRLGISAELPHKNSSGGGDFREAYTDEARQRVAEGFAGDIARFGYTF